MGAFLGPELPAPVSRGKPVTFEGHFLDGVNYESAPYNLGDGEARDLRNVQSTVRGAVRKRPGSQLHATPAVQLTSLFGVVTPTIAALIAAGPTFLSAIDGAGAVTQIAAGLTSGRRWSFIEAPVSAGQGPIFGMNGVEARESDGLLAGTGAWTAGTGTLPIGDFLTYHGNHVWVAGITTYAAASDPKSALVFSAPGAPRDWPAANLVMFDPGDGDGLTGHGPVGPNLLVCKQDKSWIVYDLETGANRPLAENVGCISHRSIVDTQHGTFFLSRDQGVMLTNGSTVKRVGDKVMPLLKAILPANRQLVCAEYFDGHYYLAIPYGDTATANNLLLDYDVTLESWWVHSHAVAALTTWERGLLGNVLGRGVGLYAPRAAGVEVDQLMVAGLFTDAGAPYESYWRGPFHVFKTQYRRKRVHQIHFDGKGRIAVTVYKDFFIGGEQLDDVDFAASLGTIGGGGIFGGSGLFGGDAEIQEAFILNPGVARAWSIELGNNTDSEFEVESYTFFLRERSS